MEEWEERWVEWSMVLEHQQWPPKKTANKGQRGAAVPPTEMFWRSVRSTERKIQMQNTCICAKTNIKELYIQVFWLQYSICVNKLLIQPPLPMLKYACVCVCLLSAELCVCLKKSESLGDHFWFLYFCTSALPNTIQARFPTLLCSARALAARNAAPANTYCSLPSTTFPGTKCKSAKCKLTRKDSAVKAAGWLFICHKEGPTGENSSSVAGPQRVPALWRYTVCSSWKNLLV